MSYRIKHVAEYLSLRTMAALLTALPYRVALFVAWMGAWVSFHVFRFRVREAISRIRETLDTDLSQPEAAHIAWVSWRNIIFSAVEILRIPGMTLEWLLSVSDCKPVMEALRRHSDTGRGGIIAVPHMGSWELAALLCHLHGIPIFSLAARQKNPLVDRYLNRLRTSHGIVTIARGGAGAMREILRRLKRGEMLAILPDVRMPDEGLSIRFLGGQANIGKGMALFARQAGVPIFPCIVTRLGWGRHLIRIHAPIEPCPEIGKETDALRMTQETLDITDAAIRRAPGQWFWFNKRWILDPI